MSACRHQVLYFLIGIAGVTAGQNVTGSAQDPAEKTIARMVESFHDCVGYPVENPVEFNVCNMTLEEKTFQFESEICRVTYKNIKEICRRTEKPFEGDQTLADTSEFCRDMKLEMVDYKCQGEEDNLECRLINDNLLNMRKLPIDFCEAFCGKTKILKVCQHFLVSTRILKEHYSQLLDIKPKENADKSVEQNVDSQDNKAGEIVEQSGQKIESQSGNVEEKEDEGNVGQKVEQTNDEVKVEEEDEDQKNEDENQGKACL